MERKGKNMNFYCDYCDIVIFLLTSYKRPIGISLYHNNIYRITIKCIIYYII